MRTIIVGAGALGRALAEELRERADQDLVVIDRDRERCDELSAALDVLCVHGDGTHPEILEKAGIREADALVAATGSDSMNAVIAMLGRHFDVARIVVRLDEPGLHAACQELGRMEIIAPRITAVARIVAVLYGERRPELSFLSRGGLELVELPAGTAAGRACAELEVPDGARLAAILRGDRLLLPRPATPIEAGDALLVLAEDEGAARAMRARLGLAAD